MKHYLKNLLTAICGRNPYQLELDKVKEEMEKASENVNALQESYYKEVEKAAEVEKLYEKSAALMAEYEKLLKEGEKQLASCQSLVENLRERCKEKDEMIDQIRKDYRQQVENYEKRVGVYNMTITTLQDKLASLTDKKNLQERGREKMAKPRKTKAKQETKTEQKTGV